MLDTNKQYLKKRDKLKNFDPSNPYKTLNPLATEHNKELLAEIKKVQETQAAMDELNAERETYYTKLFNTNKD